MFGLFNGSNTDIMDDIEAVLRPMAGMAIAKKFALHDIVGDVETWQADLESAVLLLDETEFRDIQIIGTYAFDDGTWLWAWGNQGSDFAENIVRDSFALQRYGKENGIAWLTERTFELEQDDVEAVAAVAVGIVQGGRLLFGVPRCGHCGIFPARHASSAGIGRRESCPRHCRHSRYGGNVCAVSAA